MVDASMLAGQQVTRVKRNSCVDYQAVWAPAHPLAALETRHASLFLNSTRLSMHGPFYTFKRLEADTPLAQLFNDYLSKLIFQALTCAPRYSVHDCYAALFADDKSGSSDASVMAKEAIQYLLLSTLNHSLIDLHSCVQAATDLLTRFYSEYGGNIHAFAHANRQYHLQLDGGKFDVDREVESPAKEPVAFKVDPKTMDSYSLYWELSQYFRDNRYAGEFIGSSGPDSFAYFIGFLFHAKPSFSKEEFASEYTDISYPVSYKKVYPSSDSTDEILQVNSNSDSGNHERALRFNEVLEYGQDLAAFLTFMSADEPANYRKLLRRLQRILHVEFTCE